VTPPPNAVITLLTSRAPWLARIAAYAFMISTVLRHSFRPNTSLDNLLVVDAVRHVLHGVSPYVEKRLLYPPSSIPFALLEAPFSDQHLRYVSPFITAGLLLIGWWAALRLFDVSLGSWLGVLPIGIGIIFAPVVSVTDLGSWTAPAVAATGVGLLLMGRGRWLAAGVVIGVSIAIKPMLIPLGLIFLLARRWGGFAAAAGIPVVICAVTLLFVPDPGLFFTKTLPFLLSGQDNFARLFDASLPAILPRMGIPAPLVSAARALVFIVTLVATVIRWRRGGDDRLRLVEASAILMCGVFLISTPAFVHYALIVVPPMIVSVVVPGAMARRPWFWIVLVPLVESFKMPYVDYLVGPGRVRGVFKTFLWLILMYAGLILSVLRRPPTPIAPGATARDEPDAALPVASDRPAELAELRPASVIGD
jgi:arabinofuranan 3-O-arabinosyltransferase